MKILRGRLYLLKRSEGVLVDFLKALRFQFLLPVVAHFCRRRQKNLPPVLRARENFLARLEGKPSIPAACAVSLDLFIYLF